LIGILIYFKNNVYYFEFVCHFKKALSYLEILSLMKLYFSSGLHYVYRRRYTGKAFDEGAAVLREISDIDLIIVAMGKSGIKAYYKQFTAEEKANEEKLT
jgi:hypothetical protein